MGFEKQGLNVNMDGDTYMKYLKYKDKNKTFNKKEISTILLMGGILLIGIIGIVSIYSLSAPPTEQFTYTWKGILMFMFICAGLGWVFNGTGFLLVKG